MDRRPYNNNNRRNPNETDWAGILGGLAVGAAAIGAIAAGAYGMTQMFDNDKDSEPVVEAQHLNSSSDDDVIIAVDATPEKCGGLLLNRHAKTIHYYSVDWTSHFSFGRAPETQLSDRFEMINALVAMYVFERHLPRRKNYTLILKTDNGFFKKTSKYSDDEDTRLLNKIKQKLEILNGTWMHVSKDLDTEMDNANKLSRYGTETQIPKYPGYSEKNVSSDVEHSVLNQIQRIVPAKYLAIIERQ